MLKKRILASSMASVMALTSVSVVAFADEATDKKYGETVTEEELEKYVEEMTTFADEKLYDYGTKQSERFEAALEHAKSVLDYAYSEPVDYNAAYQMLKAVYDNLETKTGAELQGLLDDYKSVYESENNFNPANDENEDLIYTQDSFDLFESVYYDATFYVDSPNGRDITDTYFTLEDAIKKLSKLPTVTKSQFISAWKDYELEVTNLEKFETWRRGTLSVVPSTSTSSKVGDLIKKKPVLTYGDIKDMVAGDSNKPVYYWDKDKWVELAAKKVDDDDHDNKEGRWIGNWDVGAAVDTTSADPTDLKDFIEAQHMAFCETEGNGNITSNPEVVGAYLAALDAVAVIKSWKEDSLKTSTEAACKKLEDKYYDRLVETFGAADTSALATKLGSSGLNVGVDQNFEKHTFSAKKDIWMIVYKDDETTNGDDAGKWFDGNSKTMADVVFSKEDDANAACAVAASGKPGVATDAAELAKIEVVKIKKGRSLFPYLRYDITDIDNTQSALDLEARYNELDATNVAGISGDKVLITSDSGNVAASGKAFAPDGDGFSITAGSTSIAITKLKKGDATAFGNLTNAQTIMDNHNTAYAELEAMYKLIGTGENGRKNLTDLADDLGEAIALLNAYDAINFSGSTKNDDAEKLFLGTDGTINVEFADGKPYRYTGSRDEWGLIYRRMFYIYEDLFPTTAVSETYTLSKLKTLINQAFDLAETAGQIAMFKPEYEKLVDARYAANEYYNDAMDEKSVGRWTATSTYNNLTLAQAYDNLKTEYDALKKWLDGFKYSYGDIQAKINEVSEYIEKNKVDNEKLEEALAQCANDLSILEPSDIKAKDDNVDNQAFDGERNLQKENRLKTSKGKSKFDPNGYEKDLLKSYDALVAAFAAAQTPAQTVVPGDTDGDGKFELSDVTAMITAYNNDTPVDAKAYKAWDMNNDEKFTLSDVTAAITKYMNM